MNEVNARRTRLQLGWVTVFGRVYLSGCNQPTRSTQPCIPPGSLNRVPASAGVKGTGTNSCPRTWSSLIPTCHFNVEMYAVLLVTHVTTCKGTYYGDSVDNTVKKNSSVFSLIGMRWLPSAIKDKTMSVDGLRCILYAHAHTIQVWNFDNRLTTRILFLYFFQAYCMLAATAKRYVRAAVFQLSFAFRLSLFCLTSIVFRVFWVIEQTGLCLLQQ